MSLSRSATSPPRLTISSTISAAKTDWANSREQVAVELRHRALGDLDFGVRSAGIGRRFRRRPRTAAQSDEAARLYGTPRLYGTLTSSPRNLFDGPRIHPEPRRPGDRRHRLHRGRRLRRQDPDPRRAGARRRQRRPLAALVERGDVSGKTGKTALLHDLPGVTAPRVLVVGLGDAGKFGVPQYLKAVGDAARALKTGPVAQRAVHAVAKCRSRAATAPGTSARPRSPPTTPATATPPRSAPRTRSATRPACKHLRSAATRRSTRWRRARPSPPASRSPASSATCRRTSATRPTSPQQAQEFAAPLRQGRVRSARPRRRCSELGMGSLLAVARGSANPPKLIVLKWNNGGDAKPYVLVGKGITFDTGGINLKTAGRHRGDEVRHVRRAPACMGTFVAAVGMQLPINLVVIVPAVENMPDADAYRPSDVITSDVRQDHRSRQHRRRRPPDPVRRADLRAALRAAGAARRGHADRRLRGRAGQVRHRPDEQARRPRRRTARRRRDTCSTAPGACRCGTNTRRLLDSTFADVYNIGGRWAGAITAGCFLARFTEGQRWAHLDIAGVANDEGKQAAWPPAARSACCSQWLLDRARLSIATRCRAPTST